MSAKKSAIPKVPVLVVTQSPLNRLRWMLDLACGHETWRTQAKRPAATAVKCETCERKAAK